MKDKKFSVLICDDSAFLRMMVKDILQKNDFEVVGETANGKQAIEEFHRLQPDLLLLDIVMPEMDGLETAKRILSEAPGFPIVMMSERSTSGMIIEAAKLGAKGFVTKPFAQQTLLKEIRQALDCQAEE